MFAKWFNQVWGNDSATRRGTARDMSVALPSSVLEGTVSTTDVPWQAVECATKSAAERQDAEANIWILPTATMAGFALMHAGLLNEAEKAHANSYRRECDRIRYVAVRALLRLALSETVRGEIESGHWRIEMNQFGKPELRPEHAFVSFSVSHAGDFSVIAVTSDATIGIDAEKVDADRIKHLPTECFTQNEQRHLDQLTEDTRHIDFYRLWTLKEAYSKALGLGFSAEFDKIEFDIDTMALKRKSPVASKSDREAFDLTSIVLGEDTYFLAICLLNAKGKPAAVNKTVYIVGA